MIYCKINTRSLQILCALLAALSLLCFVACGTNPTESHHNDDEEESGPRLSPDESYETIQMGVRLILAFDNHESSFIGTVENVTDQQIFSVSVEVHLSNGSELGPTSPLNLLSGQTASVKISSGEQSFDWWTAHAEASTTHDDGDEH